MEERYMKTVLRMVLVLLVWGGVASAGELPSLAMQIQTLQEEVDRLKTRVAELEAAKDASTHTIAVDRLVVHKELIVSDTGAPWEEGFEAHEIPRGVYARSLWDGP